MFLLVELPCRWGAVEVTFMEITMVLTPLKKLFYIHV
jgi:hypothetical protein